MIWNLSAIVLGCIAIALAVFALIRQNVVRKQILGKLREQEGATDEKLRSAVSSLRKEYESMVKSRIENALDDFAQRGADPVRKEETPVAAAVIEKAAPAYASKTFYARFIADKFDEMDFSEVQESNLAFIVRTMSDTMAEVTLNPDFDRNLTAEVRDVCDIEDGSWQNFHSVTIVSAGELSKPSATAPSWSVVKKITVKLV